MLRKLSDGDVPPAARAVFGLASLVLIVGIVLTIFVGGPAPAFMLGGLVLFIIASLIERAGRPERQER